MRLVASDLARLEELVAEHERIGAPVIRLGILNGQSSEMRAFVSTRPEQAEHVAALAQRLSDVLNSSSENDRQFRLATIASLLSKELGSE